MSRYLVTGGAKDGYGEALTRKLLSDGHDVVISASAEQEEAASKLAEEFPTLTTITIDHSDPNQVHELAELARSGSLAGVVNCEFFFAMESPDAVDLAVWNRSLAVNLTCPHLLFHELKSNVLEGGAFITVTSTEGFIGSFGAPSYAATKAAIHNLIQTHANLGAKHKVRSNAIAAGWIGGVMDDDEVFNMSRRITPLARLGDASEVADAVLYLLGPGASFVNGTVLTVDGGYRGVDTIAKYEFQTEFNLPQDS